jgi:hypothetical protein
VQAAVVTDGVCCSGASMGYETVELPESFRQLVEVEWLQPLAVTDTFEAERVAPENDDAEAASALPAGGGEAHGTLVRATSDSAVTFGGSGGSPDVWYALSPAADATFVIDTCGTHDAEEPDAGIDTILTVHDALPAADGNVVAGNEDAPEGTEPAACAGADAGQAADAALRVEVAGGTTVWIRVARAAGPEDDGSFVLHVPEPGAALAGAAAFAALAARARRARA